MKTGVVMARNLNGINVRQDSKLGFFNANDLVVAYKELTGKDKQIYHYLENESTKEYMGALIQAENQNTRDSGELENGLIKTKRGKYGGTWMHPYLFIDFAMWLSPEFKVTAIKWIYDNLIELRNNCGDGFKRVNNALFERKPNTAPFAYANEAKMINKLVFGTPDKDQRNSASEEQLAMLDRLQQADVKLIQQGLDYYDRYEKLKELKQYF